MSEEPTKENISRLLSKLPNNLTVVERVLLLYHGTVQTLLSIIFNYPVEIKVLSQLEYGGFIVRNSDLSCNGISVGIASSFINIKNIDKGMLNGLKEQRLGIGQLLSVTRHDNTTREIINVGVTNEYVWRTYSIKDASEFVDIVITEIFLRDIINGVDSRKYYLMDRQDG